MICIIWITHVGLYYEVASQILQWFTAVAEVCMAKYIIVDIQWRLYETQEALGLAFTC